MGNDLLSAFMANISAEKLLEPNDKILIAVSSGPDSMALLNLLYRLEKFSLGIFHLNHQLRDEADREERFIVDFGKKLGLPVHSFRFDVLGYCQEQQVSVETGARQIRYQLMKECSAKYDYNKIALGHHQDDQAETVLMHLIRGSGLRGLAGMKSQRDCYIRPLLPFSRSQIIDYCDQFQLPYHHDQSNFDSVYQRNKIRLELIPLIEAEYNPKFRQSLVRLADIANADNQELETQTEAIFSELAFVKDGALHLIKESFCKLSLSLQRRVLQHCIARSRESKEWVSFDQVEELRKLINNKERFFYQIPLLPVTGLPNTIIFGNLKLVPWEAGSLPTSGTINVGNYWISVEIFLKGENYLPCEDGEEFDFDQLSHPLVFRPRQPGDRMQVFGQTGSKKIKDLLIDAKVPFYMRNYIPLICDQEDILWLTGIRRSEKGRINANTNKIIRIKFGHLKDCHRKMPVL